MKQNPQILIKDPYLNSTYKTEAPVERNQNFSVPKSTFQTTHYHDNSKWKIQQQMKKQLQRTQDQFRRMARAYTEENRLNKKILGYQAVNNQYHQGLKNRNYDLNNRLTQLATQNQLLSNKFQGDYMNTFHEKDLLLRKYQTQADQLLQARKTINGLLEHKTKMQEEIQHLTFALQRQADRFNLQMRQQILRMEGLERSIKTLTETKDQQISQLRNRIRIYQDQNKRLNDQNRSLHIVNASQRDNKQNRGGIQNLSQIHHLDSQTKDLAMHKQFQDQKNINEKLQKELEQLRRKLFKSQQQIQNIRNKSPIKQQRQQTNQSPSKFDSQKIQGIINSLNSMRGGISKQIFEVFYKSVKDGQKHRSNSLVIFMQNWRHIDLQRIEPYIQSYFQTRSTIKQLYLSNKYQGKPINQKMQACIPLHIALKKGRNEVNTWILSTIQLTKNQRESAKKSMNNLLLFLFRLLTIQYRITYPMQGKSYTIDEDVKNQLAHETVKAIQYIIQFS